MNRAANHAPFFLTRSGPRSIFVLKDAVENAFCRALEPPRPCSELTRSQVRMAAHGREVDVEASIAAINPAPGPERFFASGAHKPLKTVDLDEGIQGNPRGSNRAAKGFRNGRPEALRVRTGIQAAAG